MNEKRYLLIVEDSPFQFRALKSEFAQSNWHIDHAIDEASTFRVLEQAEKEGRSIEVIALDLGLPPDPDNPFRGGIPLAEKLRRYDDELPICAYTALSPQATNYPLLLAKLLSLRISFINLRGSGIEIPMPDLFDLIWRGYVFQSPTIAGYLAKVIPDKPDPLSTPEWDTLIRAGTGRTYNQIADELSLSPDGVKTRLIRIGERLVDANELPSGQTSREDLIRWYREHAIKYCRY